MIDRIIEIANPARLSVRDSQLVIELAQAEQLSLPFTTPISEIAVLLLAHPQVILSQAVLSRIAEAGGSVVTIDGKFLPASMLVASAGALSSDRTIRQADAAFSPDTEAAMAGDRARQDPSTGGITERTSGNRWRVNCHGGASSLGRRGQSGGAGSATILVTDLQRSEISSWFRRTKSKPPS